MTDTTMSFEEWADRYKPMPNHLDANASFNGLMFETFGQELEHVRSVNPATVWTLLDADGTTVIGKGYHWINRLGYFITAEAAGDDAPEEITIDD